MKKFLTVALVFLFLVGSAGMASAKGGNNGNGNGSAPGNSGNGNGNGGHGGGNNGNGHGGTDGGNQGNDGSNGNAGGGGGNGPGPGPGPGPSRGLACEGSCRTTLSFEGDFAQSSSAFVDQAKVSKKGNVTNGAQAGAVQGNSGSYKGQSGIGITGGAGITAAATMNTPNSAGAIAVAGNLGGTMVIGSKTCAKLSGSGSAATVAVKKNGAASSEGSFKYKGQISSGAIVGGGVTGGFSMVANGHNSVVSGAGHVTASGITSSGNRN